jgi:amino acid transporter
MGRIGAFPRFLAIVSLRHRSPVYSILVAFVITVAVTLALGLKYDPTVAFAMVGTGLMILIVAIYIVMNAACIGFFARRGTGFNWLSHLVIPLLGIAAFVPAWLTAAGIKVFSFVTPLAPPLSYMGPGVAGFMVLGLIYMIYLYRTNRSCRTSRTWSWRPRTVLGRESPAARPAGRVFRPPGAARPPHGPAVPVRRAVGRQLSPPADRELPGRLLPSSGGVESHLADRAPN